jgi:hypothetical protein
MKMFEANPQIARRHEAPFLTKDDVAHKRCAIASAHNPAAAPVEKAACDTNLGESSFDRSETTPEQSGSDAQKNPNMTTFREAGFSGRGILMDYDKEHRLLWRLCFSFLLSNRLHKECRDRCFHASY